VLSPLGCTILWAYKFLQLLPCRVASMLCDSLCCCILLCTCPLADTATHKNGEMGGACLTAADGAAHMAMPFALIAPRQLQVCCLWYWVDLLPASVPCLPERKRESLLRKWSVLCGLYTHLYAHSLACPEDIVLPLTYTVRQCR